LKVLFKGCLQGFGLAVASSKPWRHLLALSGPALRVCPLYWTVKYIGVDNSPSAKPALSFIKDSAGFAFIFQQISDS
jgi:hypothetical protein